MASEISDYLANKIAAWVTGVAMPAAPAGVYVALHDGDCGVNGTAGTDVTATIRPAGRVLVDWGAVVGRVVQNDAVADFGNAAGAADIESLSLWDSAVGGNCLGATLLDAPIAATIGLPVKISVGSLEFGFPVA